MKQDQKIIWNVFVPMLYYEIGTMILNIFIW